MRSSLTSSSQVNRASRGLGRGEHPDRVDTAVPRLNLSRIYEDGRSMTQFSGHSRTDPSELARAIQKLSRRTRDWYILHFFYSCISFLPLFFISTDKYKSEARSCLYFKNHEGAFNACAIFLRHSIYQLLFNVTQTVIFAA